MKKDVLDPQGKVVSQTLKNMGYKNVINVRQGKYFEIELNETDKEKAKKIVEEICKKLLTNVVIEDYTINFKGNVEYKDCKETPYESIDSGLFYKKILNKM